MASRGSYTSSNYTYADNSADLVLTNARIYTVDPGRPWAEAAAIRHGRYLELGKHEDVERYIGEKTRVLDLAGAFVMPGLHDMHTHPDLALAASFSDQLNVALDEPRPDDIAAAIRAYAGSHPGDGWIYGHHFVRYTFREAGIEPGKAWLDSVVADRPVAILDRMWGSMMANSRAMELAGIDASSPDPRNGYLERDEVTGEPTGILVDGAYALIHAAMPPDDIEILRRAYQVGSWYQSSRGVTATKYAHVCERRLDALKRLDDAGQLPLRVEATISWQDDIFPVRRRWQLLSGERHYYRSDRLSANAVKFHFDGTAESRSSFLLSPWPGESSWRGQTNLTPEHLTDMVVDMDRRGIRVVAHCTGDGSANLFLDAVAEARRRNGPGGPRHQCAHCTILHPQDVWRFKELNVTPEFSPASWYPTPFAVGGRSSYGPERMKHIWDIAGVFEAGGTPVFGTDWPVASIDPWLAIETLVTRQNPWNDDAATMGDPVSLERALRMATINGAHAMGTEHETGSISIGKRADFIVLDRDPFSQPARGWLHKTQVAMTFLDGRLVYDRDGSHVDGAANVITGVLEEPKVV